MTKPDKKKEVLEYNESMWMSSFFFKFILTMLKLHGYIDDTIIIPTTCQKTNKAIIDFIKITMVIYVNKTWIYPLVK